ADRSNLHVSTCGTLDSYLNTVSSLYLACWITVRMAAEIYGDAVSAWYDILENEITFAVRYGYGNAPTYGWPLRIDERNSDSSHRFFRVVIDCVAANRRLALADFTGNIDSAGLSICNTARQRNQARYE